ncbi:hypothetical protein TNIN_395201 [Trichonephila inaurata madagascariensis]|uniref:Uncharacterized protein n=1 Tax=Trichonephila inaurata madagascariensis TaxID=2747483 RepID=A0A8X6YUA3_9ARAC|nr:hypothetical protein TNIN_395201 [Trichonephila inaurata madagascariensis]
MDRASGALYRGEDDAEILYETFFMKEEASAIKDIISNFESSQKVDPPLSIKQKRNLKRKSKEGTENTYEKIKTDEKTDIKNTIKGEQNDEPVDGEQNGDYLNEQQKYPLWEVSAVEQYKGNQPVNVLAKEQHNQPMDVSEEEDQDNQETMNVNNGAYVYPPGGSNTNASDKRPSENEGNILKKIKTEMTPKKYPKGSKIKYYDRFRRQIRHQQRLRGYVHLYLGTPTVMGEKYNWTIKNYPRDNLKEPQEDKNKKHTWKLVMLKDESREQLPMKP